MKLLELLKTNNIFITGGAGVGKSHTIKEIIVHYENLGKKVVALGSTGIAAVNIGGVTVHSFFGLGICKDFGELAAYDRRNKKLKDLYKNIASLDLIIIDEISMISADLMEMIAYRLRVGNFAGKMVIAGDFYQLPPVRKDIKKDLFSRHLAFESDAWSELNPVMINLTISHRTKDREFLNFLDNIRKGKIDSNDEKQIAFYANNRAVLDLDPTYLYSKNIDVDRVNQTRLEKINSKETIYEAKIKKEKNCSSERVENFIKNLTVNLHFKVKVGAPVLFTINKMGSFYNGERGEVIEITDDVIVVEKNGDEIMVERHDFLLEDHTTEKPKTLATVSQFPLRLAWAVTIHKSQGMGIETLAVNIDNIFESGQLYVALSRSSNPKKLFISSKYDAINVVKRSVRSNELVDKFYMEQQ